MPRKPDEGFTLRENQIMEIVWSLEEATIDQIRTHLKEPLADSTIRTLIGVMEKKGYVSFRKSQKGKAKVYFARIAKQEAQASALTQLIQRLFEGAADKLVLRLVEDDQLSAKELQRLERTLAAKRKGKSC